MDYRLTFGNDVYTNYDADLAETTTGSGMSRFFGLDGDDSMFVVGTRFREFGGNGNDTEIAVYQNIHYPGEPNLTDIALYGGKGNDVLAAFGGSWFAQLHGDGGNDYLVSNGIASQLYGGNGNDALVDSGLFGDLIGDKGNDTLVGNHYSQLYGGDGNDYLMTRLQFDNPYASEEGVAGPRSAQSSGGKGADVFHVEFNPDATYDNVEIKDFNAAQGDVLKLTFNDVGSGNDTVFMNGAQIFAAFDHNGDHRLDASDGDNGNGFSVSQIPANPGNYPTFLELHTGYPGQGENEIDIANVTHLDFIA